MFKQNAGIDVNFNTYFVYTKSINLQHFEEKKNGGRLKMLNEDCFNLSNNHIKSCHST